MLTRVQVAAYEGGHVALEKFFSCLLLASFYRHLPLATFKLNHHHHPLFFKIEDRTSVLQLYLLLGV